jgi:hypothetical protein
MVSDRKKSGLEKDGIENKPRIDLGFSKLVSSLSEVEEKPTAPEKSEDTSATKSTLVEQPPEVIPDLNSMSFEQLADRQEFSLLQKLSEKRMTESVGSSSIYSTIWWAVSQLKTGGVPASILSTPVSRASSEIERFSLSSSGSLVEPLLTTARIKKECASLLLQLAKKNSGALSEKSVTEFLTRAIRIDPELSSEVKSFAERELDRISKLTGRRALRESRIAEFRGILKEIESAAEDSRVKTAVSEKKKDILLPTPPMPRRSILLPTIFGLVTLGAAWFYLRAPQGVVVGGSASLVSYEENIQFAKGSFQRLESVDNLEVLLAKVNSIAVPTPTAHSVALGRSNGGGIAELGGLVNEKGNTANQGLSKKLESIDTTGPIEGTEYYRRETQRSREESASVFGSEPPGVGGLIPEQGGAGGKGPHTYRVITFTRVYAKASFFSPTIANLDSGARVEVVERFGEWLKIRSRQGQVGFMLSQDAEPVR